MDIEDTPGSDDRAARTPPAFLKALGRDPLPDPIDVGSDSFRLVHVFKHDFFAATALYEGGAGRVVLKLNRQAPMFGLPLRWVGRWLARHEAAVFERADGIDGVPRFVGRWGATGVLHAFIEGHAMRKGERVPDEFHARLSRTLDHMHARGVAVVDLEKCENVIVGDDGRPYMPDFQISWYVPRRWGGDLAPLSWVRRRLQASDRYHLLKLQRRTRPDQLSPDALARSYRKPWWVRLHNRWTRPLTRLRRAILDRLDPGRAPGERGRVDADARR